MEPLQENPVPVGKSHPIRSKFTGRKPSEARKNKINSRDPLNSRMNLKREFGTVINTNIPLKATIENPVSKIISTGVVQKQLKSSREIQSTFGATKKVSVVDVREKKSQEKAKPGLKQRCVDAKEPIVAEKTPKSSQDAGVVETRNLQSAALGSSKKSKIEVAEKKLDGKFKSELEKKCDVLEEQGTEKPSENSEEKSAEETNSHQSPIKSIKERPTEVTDKVSPEKVEPNLKQEYNVLKEQVAEETLNRLPEASIDELNSQSPIGETKLRIEVTAEKLLEQEGVSVEEQHAETTPNSSNESIVEKRKPQSENVSNKRTPTEVLGKKSGEKSNLKLKQKCVDHKHQVAQKTPNSLNESVVEKRKTQSGSGSNKRLPIPATEKKSGEKSNPISKQKGIDHKEQLAAKTPKIISQGNNIIESKPRSATRTTKELSIEVIRMKSQEKLKPKLKPRCVNLNSIDIEPKTPLPLLKPKVARGTPYHTAEKCIKCRCDQLEMASYWLTQIKLAESVGKHFVSAAFFHLALCSKAEPIRSLRGELKQYLSRHENISDNPEWKEVCVSYGTLKEKDGNSEEEHHLSSGTEKSRIPETNSSNEPVDQDQTWETDVGLAEVGGNKAFHQE